MKKIKDAMGLILVKTSMILRDDVCLFVLLYTVQCLWSEGLPPVNLIIGPKDV